MAYFVYSQAVFIETKFLARRTHIHIHTQKRERGSLERQRESSEVSVIVLF